MGFQKIYYQEIIVEYRSEILDIKFTGASSSITRHFNCQMTSIRKFNDALVLYWERCYNLVTGNVAICKEGKKAVSE